MNAEITIPTELFKSLSGLAKDCVAMFAELDDANDPIADDYGALRRDAVNASGAVSAFVANARAEAERSASPDGMTESERAMSRSRGRAIEIASRVDPGPFVDEESKS